MSINDKIYLRFKQNRNKNVLFATKYILLYNNLYMNTYKKFVHNLAENRINKVFLNSDNAKMLSVFQEMFEHSDSEFRIFAGDLCNETTGSKEYIESISNFIEKKGRLYILLNDFRQERAVTHNLYKRLAYYQSLGEYHIFIKSTRSKILYNDEVAHLAIGDHCSYRIETDIEKRTAICNMSSPEYSEKLVSLFDGLFSDEGNLVVDLVKIFNFFKDGVK